MVMTTRIFATIGVILIALTTLSSCANTIRGMGQDTANTVNATESAGRRVAKAAN
ncbi:entericidin [Sinorhizobium fredii USDA 205]|nr:entericidin [Sinorhizobium fredii USDA 205]